MLPALIVGGFTGWFLGLRPGIIAAVATALVLLVANFIPGATFTIYGLIVGWCALLYFFGKSIAGGGSASRSSFGKAASGVSAVSSLASRAKKAVGDLFDSNSK